MSIAARLKRLERLQNRLDEIQFCKAMQRYLRLKGQMVIAWCEVLMVVRALGYRKLGLVEREARPPSE